MTDIHWTWPLIQVGSDLGGITGTLLAGINCISMIFLPCWAQRELTLELYCFIFFYSNKKYFKSGPYNDFLFPFAPSNESFPNALLLSFFCHDGVLSAIYLGSTFRKNWSQFYFYCSYKSAIKFYCISHNQNPKRQKVHVEKM